MPSKHLCGSVYQRGNHAQVTEPFHIKCHPNTVRACHTSHPPSRLWPKPHLSYRTQALCEMFPGIHSNEDTPWYCSLNESSDRVHVIFFCRAYYAILIVISHLYTYSCTVNYLLPKKSFSIHMPWTNKIQFFWLLSSGL